MRVHFAISKTLEGLLFRTFKDEAARHMLNEVFNIACEDEDLIADEEIKILSELDTQYENYNIRVRGIISRFYLYH